MKRFGICSAVFAWVLVVAGFVGAAEEKVPFLQSWTINEKTLPFYVAIERGYYKKANLNVVIERGFGSSDSIKKVAAGGFRYGIADAGAVVIGRSRGAMVKLLALQTAQSQHGWHALKSSGIAAPKDLEGKTTGGPQGDVHKTLWPAFAKANGIDPKKLKWITMPSSAEIGSLLSGKVDVIPFFTSVGLFIRLAAKKSGKAVVTIPWAKWGIDIYSLSIIATDETIKKNRDQVKRFVGASVRGIAWAIENPGRAVEILRKHNPATNAGLMRKAWEMNIDSLLTPEAQKIGVSMMSEEKMRRTRDLMAKYSNLKMAVPVKDLYTNEFVPRLFPKRGM